MRTSDKIQRTLAIIVMTLLVTTPGCARDNSDKNIYTGLSEYSYLTGRFNPANNSGFTRLDTLGIPTNGKTLYLRNEAATALVRMYNDMQKDLPGIKFWVQSSTRSFDDQKGIWNNKWNGVTLVNGAKLNQTIPDPRERALKILIFSSMPGTSRHHWGTDFDINILTNDYYEKGDGLKLYEWLHKNASRYGFGQPYTSGRTSGYAEEKWHWSYLPLSKPFLRDWIKLYNSKPSLFNSANLFAGSENAGDLAPIYVNSINPECQPE